MIWSNLKWAIWFTIAQSILETFFYKVSPEQQEQEQQEQQEQEQLTNS